MTTEIRICMGSACFAKGNQENLEYMKKYIDDNNLDAEIMITGSLCENKCDKGPRVIVDGVEYNNVTKEKFTKLIKNERN